ncbi:MAG: peptidoglycan-binding protein [Oscillospiraceae bacterium]|jgi:hypothetical protein|nr:peptidoglycan-binding protein [Oscillospiraceae bacterium]
MRRWLGSLAALALLFFACPAHADPPDAGDDTGAFVEELLAVATGELGQGKISGGGTLYAAWFGNRYSEWCSEFVAWCVDQADQRLGTHCLDSLYPYGGAAVTFVNWYTSRGRYVTIKGSIKGWGDQWYLDDGTPVTGSAYVPQRGDVVFFEWYQYNRIDHVGIVEYVTQDVYGAFTIHTIEGNNKDNPVVSRFSYPLDDPSIRAYGVRERVTGIELHRGASGVYVLDFQQMLTDTGRYDGPMSGVYDTPTIEAVRRAQLDLGLEPTGVADQVTQTALGFP